jgi:hypothetical protein
VNYKNAENISQYFKMDIIKTSLRNYGSFLNKQENKKFQKKIEDIKNRTDILVEL